MRETWERSRYGRPATIPVNNRGYSITHETHRAQPGDSRASCSNASIWRKEGFLQESCWWFKKWRVESRNRGSRRWPDFFLVAMVGVTPSLP